MGQIVVVRHGETGWSLDGKHTGRTDVPLTDEGRQHAAALASRLRWLQPAIVLTSPRQRARDTCRLAGFGDVAAVSDDLVEWDYGDYEGRTTAEIRTEVPGWSLWRDGVPGGETAAQVAIRADRVIERLQRDAGDALLFSHGHLLRVLAARWLGLPPDAGRLLALAPASVSVLGWEREQRVLSTWNELVR